MLKNISWSHYIISITGVLISYYIVVLARYYLSEIKQILAGNLNVFPKKVSLKRNTGSSSSAKTEDNHNYNLKSDDSRYSLIDLVSSNPDLLPVISESLTEIKGILDDARQKHLIKDEITFSIHQLLKNYISIKNSQFRSFVSDYILINCAEHCSIHLDEGELTRLWN